MERLIEQGLFRSRWLLAPMYVGLVGALCMLVVAFAMELFHLMAQLPGLSASDAVLGALSLIDLTLAGNLLLIVIFSGYENFVSKMDIKEHEDRPEWQGTVDFSALKLKLVASIIAISGIHLLKVFMEVGEMEDRQIMWMCIIHVIFIFSGVMLAWMDHLSTSAKVMKGKSY